jgi:hypothetical protein
MLLLALLFAAGGIVLAREAWVSDPRLRVPPSIGYVVAVVCLATALMIALQAAGVGRWNDLLAAVLFFGCTVEFLWYTFGAGARPCRMDWWSPPESVCRTGLALGALMFGVLTVWAIRRYRAQRSQQRSVASSGG